MFGVLFGVSFVRFFADQVPGTSLVSSLMKKYMSNQVRIFTCRLTHFSDTLILSYTTATLNQTGFATTLLINQRKKN